VVSAAGASASALQDAAATGDELTITVTASPFVYDLVLPESDRQDLHQRDGTVVRTVPGRSTQFPVPAERGNYRLICRHKPDPPPAGDGVIAS
jgi:hypothetical protein